MSDFLETIHFSSASEFLDYLQLRSPHWLPSNAISSPWVFRGQRRDDWQLLPRAFRNTHLTNSKAFYRDEIESYLLETDMNLRFQGTGYRPTTEAIRDLFAQIVAEHYAVDDFIRLMDKIGHSVPEDGYSSPPRDFSIKEIVNTYLIFWETDATSRTYSYPYPESIAYALAQHHGVSTRLLDWTYSPYISAFFAAEEAIYNQENASEYNLAVWAINRDRLHDTNLKLVMHRRAKISYLHAQEGLFIYDRLANRYFIKEGYWRTFEQALQTDKQLIESPVLRKVTLPAAKSPELLRLLAVERITRAHIMPTLDNVTRTLETKRLIQLR